MSSFFQIPEIKSFGIQESAFEPLAFKKEDARILARTKGWVAGAQRTVEVYENTLGILLNVEGGSEILIAPHGETISTQSADTALSQIDREIILGPALVLALALRGTWSLHASAAMYKENTVIFLGESGMGKSTLAAYLSKNEGWQLVADDILPVKMESGELKILPHFPQLKLPRDAQPGINFPESLPLKTICLLEHAQADKMPELKKASTAQAAQMLLAHIAGTRMFNTDLLEKHLKFSTLAAQKISAYRLTHPHRRDTLPLVKEFLEKIC